MATHRTTKKKGSQNTASTSLNEWEIKIEGPTGKQIFCEYMKLPTAEELLAMTAPAKSPQAAFELIKSAQAKAWSIRMEFIRGLTPQMFGRLKAIADSRIKSGDEYISQHPIRGPLWSYLYEELVVSRQSVREENEKRMVLKKEEKDSRLREGRKKGAIGTNKTRDINVMIACTEAYVAWKVQQSEGGLNDNSFSRPNGISAERAECLIGALRTALTKNFTKEDLRGTLERCGFRYVTDEVAMKCLSIFKKSLGG